MNLFILVFTKYSKSRSSVPPQQCLSHSDSQKAFWLLDPVLRLSKSGDALRIVWLNVLNIAGPLGTNKQLPRPPPSPPWPLLSSTSLQREKTSSKCFVSLVSFLVSWLESGFRSFDMCSFEFPLCNEVFVLCFLFVSRFNFRKLQKEILTLHCPPNSSHFDSTFIRATLKD